MEFVDYQDRFSWARLERDEGGILLCTLNTDGDTLTINSFWKTVHREIGDFFYALASDRETRAIILTGTGDNFIEPPPAFTREQAEENHFHSSESWDVISREANALIMRHLEIPVPMIGVLNGPAPYHAELAVMCDVVLAADDSYVSDAVHFLVGNVPGDGVHVIWNALLGPNRARYFLITGEKIYADEARRLGVVHEVMPASELLERAYEHARMLTQTISPSVLRSTRMLLTQPLRQAAVANLDFGLALEGLGAWARKASQKTEPGPDYHRTVE
jgi:enoyl-CoA hydratase/carnithine racemase